MTNREETMQMVRAYYDNTRASDGSYLTMTIQEGTDVSYLTMTRQERTMVPVSIVNGTIP
jgi:hypothetical protein